MPKAYIRTFGCQMNEHDSQRYQTALVDCGYTICAKPDGCDLFLLNTCTVRDNAESRFLGRLADLSHHKRKNPNLIIVVAGCIAQDQQAALLERAPYVDIVLGTFRKNDLLQVLAEYRRTGHPAVVTSEQIDDSYPIVQSSERSARAWLTVMEGCNNYCSYCIVPYVRGKERSKPLAVVVQEARLLVASGHLEITLLGQNVNSYRDPESGAGFAQLLTELHQITEIARWRYMTSHPKDLDDTLIQTLSQLERVCPHHHFPVQSGSDRILERMNRKYTSGEYLERVSHLRALWPQANLTTDIIVGFPGETDADFAATMELLAQVRFDSLFVFCYSPRKGTLAADKYGDTVPHQVKVERLDQVLQQQRKITYERNSAMVGQKLTILVEGESHHSSSAQPQLLGRTACNKPVVFDYHGSGELKDCFVELEIVAAKGYTLMGRIL